MSGSHLIKLDSYHYMWSKNHPPVLEIETGEKVTFQVQEVTSCQLTKTSTSDDVAKLDAAKFYPLAGPIKVRGAVPGDALAIDVLKIETADWGWSAVIPGLGTLEEFTKPFLWTWKLSKRKWLKFRNGLRVRFDPFCGVMGVAPASEGLTEVMPPGNHGGNMDIRHLTVGSRLILPVWVEGALFSVGDVHASQGDGEVCVTAIECSGEVTLRFNLIKKAQLDAPRFFTASKSKNGKYYVTTGISPDLMDASRKAVRRMIDDLTRSSGVSREEAYIFCSVVGDLRIHEIVDQPNWVVGFMIPLDCLGVAGKRILRANA
ncbi:MAG: acetamidase/formamidase family protein [Candidatus Bathyarchaeia archaeon]